MNSTDQEPVDLEASRARVKRLAWLFDEAIRIPGTRISLGVDSIAGLIPGIGDLLGVALGMTVLYEGVRANLPGSLLRKMAGNAAIDAVGGLLPVVGDLFDVAFKSNSRNARIILDYLDECEREANEPPPEPGSGPKIAFGLAALVMIAALAGGVALLVV